MTDTGFQFAVPASGAPDPFAHYELYRGVALKRAIAYLIDLLVIGFFLLMAAIVLTVIGVLTFGLLHPLLITIYALIPFCYHTLLLGGPSHATLGMRIMGVEMRSLTIGRPDYLQAAVQTVLFYLSIAIFSPILLWALFDSRRRMLHDILAGTYVVNRHAAAGIPA